MLVDNIVYVGVGQCGSNVVKELENKGFNSFYVNTSLEDLDTLEVDRSKKYHISGFKGMAKDKEYALEVITKDNNAENIAYAINDRYANCNIVNFIYSLSGGTGGTMGGIIAETTADLFGDKLVNVVIVLPRKTEDIGLQANAIKSLKQIIGAYEDGYINNIQILDNNCKKGKLEINREFATLTHDLINFDYITDEGNLDSEEMERVITQRGFSVILEFENEDFKAGLIDAMSNTIYAPWLKSAELHGLILNKEQVSDENIELIKEVLGIPVYTHDTIWDNKNNILIASGMKFNKAILRDLERNYMDMVEKKRKIEEEILLQQKELDEDKFKVDFSDIENFSSKRKMVSDNNTQKPTSRRRGRTMSSVLDKYRKV